MRCVDDGDSGERDSTTVSQTGRVQTTLLHTDERAGASRAATRCATERTRQKPASLSCCLTTVTERKNVKRPCSQSVFVSCKY